MTERARPVASKSLENAFIFAIFYDVAERFQSGLKPNSRARFASSQALGTPRGKLELVMRRLLLRHFATRKLAPEQTFELGYTALEVGRLPIQLDDDVVQ